MLSALNFGPYDPVNLMVCKVSVVYLKAVWSIWQVSKLRFLDLPLSEDKYSLLGRKLLVYNLTLSSQLLNHELLDMRWVLYFHAKWFSRVYNSGKSLGRIDAYVMKSDQVLKVCYRMELHNFLFYSLVAFCLQHALWLHKACLMTN